MNNNMDEKILLGFTGHTYYDSESETSTSCGNCDGARCHNCRKCFWHSETESYSYEEFTILDE